MVILLRAPVDHQPQIGDYYHKIPMNESSVMIITWTTSPSNLPPPSTEYF